MLLTFGASGGEVFAANQNTRPSLIITSEPVPMELKKQVYATPTRVREIKASDISGRSYYQPSETLVSRKIEDIHQNLNSLQAEITDISAQLNSMQRNNQQKAAQYYAAVATINTQLQSGTTPGNPRLVQKIKAAETSLQSLSASVTALNGLASRLAEAGSQAGFLLEETRAAYSISGAIEEDHVRLAELEDAIHNTTVIIERVMNNVSDDLSRLTTYMSTESNNLRTLTLAVANGDLYGKSLSNRPFSMAKPFENDRASSMSTSASVPGPAASASSLSGPRPLVKIRFDRPDIDYQEPVYKAVNQALERYPEARFDLVAVHPTAGNAAEVAIESTRARRNAERVLRTLTQMGLPLERIDLSYNQSAEAKTNEVHLYIR